jgi:RNA polymerase sigma-70 factor (ECF subfamily)
VTDSDVIPPGDNPEATSLTLLEKAISGSESAWQRLVSLYEPLVNRWCRAAGFQDADVANVRQEVFVAVHRSLPGFEKNPEQGSFRGWLRTITHNKMRDLWQRQREQQGQGGSDAYEQFMNIPSPQADSSCDVEEENSLLYRRALDLLRRDFSEPTWRAFWRLVIDGQRPSDVAPELNMTPGAVSSAKARVLKRLRQEFAGLLGDEPTLCLLPGGKQHGGTDES